MEQLKNMFFQETFIVNLSDEILANSESFDKENFEKVLLGEEFCNLELKAKLRQCAITIGDCMDTAYLDSIDILEKVAPKFSNFDALVFPEFVDVYGQDYIDESLEALGYFTSFGSSEFAIRSYANRDLDKVFELMNRLALSKDENQRRFASEGIRPKLPWAKSVKKLSDLDYIHKILEILEILKDDSALFVRKSVANNLNDISKLEPQLVLDKAKNWYGKSENVDWILKQGLRTLLKKGDKEALSIWGLNDSTGVLVESLDLEKEEVNIGDVTSLVSTFTVENNKKIRGEFKVHYLKMNGSHSIKTFSFFEKDFKAGRFTMKKKISFKEMSTRKHYPGLHKIEMVINGDVKMQIEFQLGKKRYM